MVTGQRIFFLLSGKRTGSTMVSRILDSHSEVCSPFELAVPYILGRAHWKYGTAVKKARVIAAHYGVRPGFLEPSRFFGWRKHEVERIRAFVEAVLRAERKTIFVIKEPAHLERAADVVSAFGLGSTVVLLRGPLATASSLHWTFGDRQPLRTWVSAYRIVPQLAGQGGFTVRYEDVLERPHDTVGQICAFLGVSFEEGMLEYGSFPHADDELPLWYRDREDSTLVPTGASRLHRVVAEGEISPSHNERCLARVPEEILEAYLRDEYGVRTLGEELGYREVEEIERLRRSGREGVDSPETAADTRKD